MTRERAIELIGAMKGDLCDFYDYDDLTALDMAISALSDYDKMQEISLDLAFENDELINKSRWIPVSERLPENDGQYLVAYDREDEILENISYFDRHGFWIGNVVAWMPLPEPYKADMRGET